MEAFTQQFPANNFTLLGLVLALPLLGAFVNGVFGKRLGKEGTRLLALTVVGLAFIVSLATFLTIAFTHVPEGGPATRLTWSAWNWFSVTGQMRQSIPIDITFSADALSATMMLVVTGIGFLIHLYSVGYMEKDPGFCRFFAYLNLFIFSMMVLILGDNMAVLFVGWEGVGLCSYLLIGFWFDDEKKASAGKKAFITNRIGDFGLLVAMAMLVYYAGTLNWGQLERGSGGLTQMVKLWPITNLQASALPDFLANWLTPDEPVYASVATLVGLALFLGCAGKSAQIPLYVWLPDAMAGPTPVSALIHAATMVTAGVYLVARTSFIFVQSPAAMAVVAATGALTALLAASIAFAQTDLKKVLAYSTVSQLGFMFMGVGVGAFGDGMFHVVTHAFFKGCLFLCAGSVIHAMHVRIHDDDLSQDMRKMGGLRKYMPVTHITYLVSCLAIAGCPLLAGFWSKDEILLKAYSNKIVASGSMWTPAPWFGQAIWVIGVIAAIGTAFYMFRSYFMTFWGEFRGWQIDKRFKPPKHDHHHHDHDVEDDKPIKGPVPHESPWTMTLPLAVLAAGAAVVGFANAHPLHIAPLGHMMEPVFQTAAIKVGGAETAKAMMWPLMAVGISAFFIGAGAAYYVYVIRVGAPAAAFCKAMPRLHKLVENKWKIDELYEATIIGMVDAMGDTAAQFDKWVIDGIIAKVTAAITRALGVLLRALQTGRMQVYAAAMVLGVAMLGWFAFRPHAEVKIDDSKLRKDGDIRLTAAPGLGYKYRWRTNKEEAPKEFTTEAKFDLGLRRCETKAVHLEVQNALGRVTEESFERCRETFPGCCAALGEEPPAMPLPSGLPALPKIPQIPKMPGPGRYDAGVIQDLLKQGRKKRPVPEPRKGGGR